MKKNLGLRTWIEIDKKALKNNYDIFRKLINKDCLLMAVTKSNAYGHGLIDYSLEMERLGADWIGVDSVIEALKLREKGIKLPILVLGYTLPENFLEAAENNISITVSDFENLYALKKISGKIKIHLKIDTGMHRQGFSVEEVLKAVKFLKERSLSITLEGVYSHFAAAKNPAFPVETTKQIENFKKAIEIIESHGFKPLKHTAATAGTIVFPNSHFDMVRVGIGLMGLWPSYETKNCYEDRMKLVPALSWKTIVSEIKKVKKDESIGYDFTETLGRDSVIAILPIGYWHGYRRDLSSIGHVLVRGKKAKVIGRISMDMIVIDITDIKNVRVGDHVTLLGEDQKECVTAYDLALLAETSWYEIVTQLNPLIKRLYL